MHADFKGATHVFAGLADTGKHDLFGFATRRQHTLQLATRDDVETGAKARQDIEHAQVGVGFYGEADHVRHTAQRVGVGTVLRFDVSARVDIGRRAEALGNGRQCYPFREQLTVAVVEGVHWSPLKVLVRLRFGLFVRGFGVIR